LPLVLGTNHTWLMYGKLLAMAGAVAGLASISLSRACFGSFHSPSGPRYVGRPALREIPAPVSTTIRR